MVISFIIHLFICACLKSVFSFRASLKYNVLIENVLQVNVSLRRGEGWG